jgi:hypothetical protein
LSRFWQPFGRAQEETEQRGLANIEEPNLVLEIGPAAEWPLHGERENYGGNIAVEEEIIEDWLELEAGLTGFGTSGRSELSADILFKKPFRLSPQVEFFLGVGPEIAHAFSGSDKGTSASIEFATELMFLPRSGIAGIWNPHSAFCQQPGGKRLALPAALPSPSD